MNPKASPFDPAFIENQRQQLVRLRDALRGVEEGTESDEADIKAESADNPREYEDDAQKLATLELDGNLVVRDVERLGRVSRALEKIADGTYGLSDVSGAPIPRERLEIIPEAICTLAEEASFERQRPA
jgi:DnaK suppressor protein